MTGTTSAVATTRSVPPVRVSLRCIGLGTSSGFESHKPVPWIIGLSGFQHYGPRGVSPAKNNTFHWRFRRSARGNLLGGNSAAARLFMDLIGDLAGIGDCDPEHGNDGGVPPMVGFIFVPQAYGQQVQLPESNTASDRVEWLQHAVLIFGPPGWACEEIELVREWKLVPLPGFR